MNKLKRRKIRVAQQARSKDTVDTILQATAKIVRESGLADLSTNRIAHVAGVGVGSVYEYFNNKDDILRHLLDACIEQQISLATTALAEASELPFEQGVRRAVSMLLQTFAASTNLTMVLAMQAHIAGASEQLAQARTRVHGLLVDWLKANDVEPLGGDLDRTVFILMHAVAGVIRATASQRPDDLARGELADAIAELVLRCVSAACEELALVG
jgi:AcrR family transcriptional regulator